MALTYDQISGITQRKILPKLVDNIFNSNILMARMKKKGFELVDGGTSIDCPLNYAQPTASGWYTGADTLVTTDNDIITAATYSWKQFYESIAILRSDELKNSGDSAIISLVKNKIKIAEKDAVDKFGTGIYSNATDAKSIVGLRQIISTSNTIGGISQSSYSWWQAQVDASTTTISLSAIQTQFNLCTIGNDQPTVMPTTRALYNSVYALLQPQQRFVDSETAKAGFSSIMVNGVPVVADNKCPTGYFFLLNEDYLHFWTHKDENLRFEPFQKPINQSLKVAHIYWMGAFGSDNNRLHGGFTALTG